MDHKLLIELQTRVEFQEETIEQLGQTLTAQQREIQALRADVRHLQDLVQQLTPALTGQAGDEPPPPHY
jgi:SlyX protein